jgi:hypothetical protein
MAIEDPNQDPNSIIDDMFSDLTQDVIEDLIASGYCLPKRITSIDADDNEVEIDGYEINFSPKQSGIGSVLVTCDPEGKIHQFGQTFRIANTEKLLKSNLEFFLNYFGTLNGWHSFSISLSLTDLPKSEELEGLSKVNFSLELKPDSEPSQKSTRSKVFLSFNYISQVEFHKGTNNIQQDSQETANKIIGRDAGFGIIDNPFLKLFSLHRSDWKMVLEDNGANSYFTLTIPGALEISGMLSLKFFEETMKETLVQLSKGTHRPIIPAVFDVKNLKRR